MIVGPTKALFMDEISNGLDSSTTYQIICYLQQLSHITDATLLVSLLQPAPETFDLFDDIILMAEGKVVYHGARINVLEFFKSCGFCCPERKGVADFLQEVISRKDQEQYWHEAQRPYSYISVDMFSRKYKESLYAKELSAELAVPFDKSKGQKDALSFSTYSLPKWTLFRACMSREFLLLKRNSFVHIFRFLQLVIIASIAMTVFLRTEMGVDIFRANSYLGALYYSLIIFMFDVFSDLSMTTARLPNFYKQRELYFYPAWAFAVPFIIIRIPISLLVSVVWTSLTYYVIGFTPEPGRFFRQMILMFAAHMAFLSMYRFVASVFRSVMASKMVANLVNLFVLLFGGFNIPKCECFSSSYVVNHFWSCIFRTNPPFRTTFKQQLYLAASMPIWLRWAFWISPLSYGMMALSGNEFHAPRWQKELSGGTTIGLQTLENRGFNFGEHLFWISVFALLGFAVLFNIGFTLALSFLKAPVYELMDTDLHQIIRSNQQLTDDHCRVSLVSKDSSMLDGLDNASIEMEEAKVCVISCILLFGQTLHCRRIRSAC